MSVVLEPHFQAVTDNFPYESPSFYQTWWRFLAPRFPLGVRQGDFVVHHKPLLGQLFSLKELRMAGWNNAWNQELTPERVEQLLDFSKEAPWDVFRMTWAEGLQDPAVFSRLAAAGMPTLQKPVSPQYGVDLTTGWEGYLASVSGNARKMIRRRLRRAEELNPQIRPFEGPEAIDTFFKIFFPLHLAYWDDKAGYSYFHDAHEQAFAIAWAQAQAEQGQLLLDGLYLGDELAQLSMSILTPTTHYWVLTINTGVHADAYPGLLALYLRVQQEMQLGQRRLFNMGSGDYHYKQEAANVLVPCHELWAANPRSVWGKLYLQRQARQKDADGADN